MNRPARPSVDARRLATLLPEHVFVDAKQAVKLAAAAGWEISPDRAVNLLQNLRRASHARTNQGTPLAWALTPTGLAARQRRGEHPTT